MCTATYFPLSHGGFVLTHSRDEKTVRSAAHRPQTYVRNGQNILFPKDPQGGGTWIATTAQTTVCLLNGAFTPHIPMPPYKHSRGLVPLHVFDYDSITDFLHHYDPSGLEPFTLLLAQMSRLVELRWNGRRLSIQDKDPDRPHIWSSATLYSTDVIEKREGWFRDWRYQNPQPTVGDIRGFHQSAGDGDVENALRMNRRTAFGNNALMTLSLTSVVHHDETVDFIYEDFTQHTFSQQTIRPAYAIA